MSDDNRIILAHEPDFHIGAMNVFPSTREVERDGACVVVEPRVMQVLVALFRAKGAVVSKDDLVHSCWEGRVVGEDAINRVMSRLRQLSAGPGANIFEVETVTRVGYRLRAESLKTMSTKAEMAGMAISRRHMLAGGSVVAAGLAGWWLTSRGGTARSAVDDLIDRGHQAALYGTPEQGAVGISLLQQAVERAPNNADAWAKLALAYGGQAQQSPQGDFERMIEQAQSAGRRALELDPDNADALVGKALSEVGEGGRIERDPVLRDMTARFPDNPLANRAYSFHLSQSGRMREALPLLQKVIALEPYSPTDAHAVSILLWCVNRLEEADRAMERAYDQWPRHYGVWFARYKHFAYAGRFAEARAMIDNIGQRPTGIPDENFALITLEVRALESRAAPDIPRAKAAHLEAAKTGIGFVQNAMTFAAKTGDDETIFRLADALYFNRGLTMPQQRYTRAQGLYNPSGRRPVHFLFTPPFAPYWRDPRFAALMEELGLTAYWKATRSTPDYQRGSTSSA